MKNAKPGDVVKIYCIGQTEDGDVFENTITNPMEFEIGSDDVITGLQNGVIGMGIGEKKSIRVFPGDGFGKRQKQLVEKVPLHLFPKHVSPIVGRKLRLTLKEGRTIDYHIKSIEKKMVTLDANHPLAGKILNFEVKLLSIN
jgi:peptidylprolyl isomerase